MSAIDFDGKTTFAVHPRTNRVDVSFSIPTEAAAALAEALRIASEEAGDEVAPESQAAIGRRMFASVLLQRAQRILGPDFAVAFIAKNRATDETLVLSADEGLRALEAAAKAL